MKICIIGAGFFGLHTAKQILKKYPSSQIEIYESSSAPFLGASSNNQCRLHMGFHYPRSAFTIYQSIMGYDRFSTEYPGVCSVIGSNYYAIHSQGLVSAEEYFAVMDSFHLNYEFQPPPSFIKKQQDIEAVIRVPEQWIDLNLLKKNVLNDLRCKFEFNACVSNIDPMSGEVFLGAKSVGEFDFVINATYVSPNMGFRDGKFHVKYELAALVDCHCSFDANTALTIMDGPYVSIYPSSTTRHTLSSVVHTPFIFGEGREKTIDRLDNILPLSQQAKVQEKIIEHVQSLVEIEVDHCRLWLAPKVKLAGEFGDSRTTEMVREGKLMSILCGKLDSVFSASDKILSSIADGI